MARSYNLDATLVTSDSSNPLAALATVTLDETGNFTQQSIDAGVIAIGVDYFDVPFGEITTAKVAILSLETAANVRLEGTAVLEDVTWLIIKGGVTSIEVQRDAAETIEYSVELFA